MENTIKLVKMDIARTESALASKRADFEAIKAHGIEENRSVLVKVLVEIDDLEHTLNNLKYDLERFYLLTK